jgi:hypothetical protein
VAQQGTVARCRSVTRLGRRRLAITPQARSTRTRHSSVVAGWVRADDTTRAIVVAPSCPVANAPRWRSVWMQSQQKASWYSPWSRRRNRPPLRKFSQLTQTRPRLERDDSPAGSRAAPFYSTSKVLGQPLFRSGPIDQPAAQLRWINCNNQAEATGCAGIVRYVRAGGRYRTCCLVRQLIVTT